MEKKIEITYRQLAREAVEDEISGLLNAAELALLDSHAPYSHFFVGAALLLEDGTVLRGSNQENAAYPVGYCAERTALAARIAVAPGKAIRAIGIATMSGQSVDKPPVAPCGMCRQALLEEETRQGSPIAVWLAGTDNSVILIDSVADLLPFRFDGRMLR